MKRPCQRERRPINILLLEDIKCKL